jgi:hypothetical protein
VLFDSPPSNQIQISVLVVAELPANFSPWSGSRALDRWLQFFIFPRFRNLLISGV